MTAVQDTDRARPASGIAIVPGQLTRMRNRFSLSAAGLAVCIGELLFDRDRFAEVVTGRVQPDAQMARALWLALDASPHDLLRGLPRRLPVPKVPQWLRRNKGKWSLDTDAMNLFRGQRSLLDEDTGEIRTWTPADLADAAARRWFSRDTVNKMEAGARRPSAETLEAICVILECRPEDLMPGGEPLPDGETARHRDVIRRNKIMRDWADAQDPPVQYRTAGTGRIQYRKLEKAYEGRAS